MGAFVTEMTAMGITVITQHIQQNNLRNQFNYMQICGEGEVDFVFFVVHSVPHDHRC